MRNRAMSTLCPKLWMILCLCFCVNGLFAQSTVAFPGGGGTFTTFPKNNQLFPRNSSNEGTVVFAGTMTNPITYPNFRLDVTIDGNNDGDYDDAGVDLLTSTNYSGGTSSFSISYSFPSELVNRKMELIGINGSNNELTLRTVENIVAGDAIMVYGQSNAIAPQFTGDADADATFATRKFVRAYGRLDCNNVNCDWDVAIAGDDSLNNILDFEIGQWAMRMSKKIIEEQNIPVAILIGGLGNSTIATLQRNDANPLTTSGSGLIYSRLLLKSISTGLRDHIKALIYYQGESDATASMTVGQYLGGLESLLEDWQDDYPSIENFYLFQLKPACSGNPMRAQNSLAVQEAQRQFEAAHSSVKIISTNYTVQYADPLAGLNWCHYEFDQGYSWIGDRAFTVLNRDLYGVTPPANSLSPRAIQAYYWENDPINPGQVHKVSFYLESQTDTYSLVNEPDLRSRFVLGPGNYPISNVTLTGNRVELTFSRGSGVTVDPVNLSFLGEAGQLEASIINSGNIGLMSFFELPISGFDPLPVDPLTLRVVRNGMSSNRIIWEAENHEVFNQFEVQWSSNGLNYTTLETIYADGSSGKNSYSFYDNRPKAQKSFYRIRAVQNDDKELYSQVVIISNSTAKVEFKVFPNPAINQANIAVHIGKEEMGRVEIFDFMGRMVASRKIQLYKGNNTFSIGELLDHPKGTYLIKVTAGTESFYTKAFRQ